MSRSLAAALLLSSTLALAQTPPQTPPSPLARPQPKDVREPPFGEFDFSWLDGSNSQPASLLGLGPVAFSLYVDTYYAWQFHAPIDHTIFPSTVAPRHNEISLNLAHLGVELNGLDGPIGRLYVQYGSDMETVAGQDRTVERGYFLNSLRFVEQVAVGWHFHALHGINAELGIFPSYVGLESYLPQENWNYTHTLLSDSTPFYFAGLRVQLFPTARTKIELWLVNGWQTFGQWQEARAGGYSVNWRPREALSLIHSIYAGQDAAADSRSVRLYSDNSVQLRWLRGRHIRWLATALVVDGGWEYHATTADGAFAGATLSQRAQWTKWLATTVRGDLFYDRLATLIPHLPLGDPYATPTLPTLAGGITITQDFSPSPWVLFRLEYAHREANAPYFSGRGGITGPAGVQGPIAVGFVPDLQTRDDRLILNATLRL